MRIGDRIRQRRKELGMSAEELAERIGKDRATVYRYETGDIENLPISIIEPIAKALFTTPAYLMGWEETLPNNAIPYKRGRKIPIVGTIPAGSPILAIENIEGYDYADVPEDREYFFLRVKGDSMVNANIFEGDLVLVEKCPCAENGQIVACIINGEEATLKRFYRQKDTVILQPENPAYPPIIVSCKDFDAGYARILGVVRELKRKF